MGHTEPLALSASQIAWRMREKARPNYINSGTNSLLVVALTLSLPSSGFADRLRMRRSHWCAWGDATIWDSLSLSPNTCTASSVGRRRLNLSHTRRYISLRMNNIISGEHVDAWVPFAIARSRASLIQGSPMSNRMTSYT